MAAAAVQAVAAAAQAQVQPATRVIRWSDPAQTHVTLQFLGATAPARLPDLLVALGTVAARQPAFRLRTAGLGAFPDARQPRVVWLALDGELDQVARLYRAVVAVTGPLGFRAEARPYAPHLTLGRVRPSATPAERRVIGQAVASAQLPTTDWPVLEMALMRSNLSQSGATYAVVGRWSLSPEQQT
jgi:2'-5' RNA ligase